MSHELETKDSKEKVISSYIEDNNFQYEILLNEDGYGLWISKAVGGILCLGSLKNGEFAFDFQAMDINPEKALVIATKLTKWAEKRSSELVSNR